MTKQIKNIIKWTGLTLLFGLPLWFAYDFHFKYVINDYQFKQIEKRLQNNFYNNQDSFNDLRTFSKQFSRFEDVEFRKNGQISFQVYDTILDRTRSDYNIIRMGDNSIYEASDIKFIDSNAIEVIYEDQAFTIENWVVNFEGEINNPLVKKLLSYNNISIDQLKQLNQKLDNINCHRFDKNDSLITIRYAGHWGEGFNYIFSLKNKSDKANWNKLTDNYYWEHYRNGLFCGWTNW